MERRETSADPVEMLHHHRRLTTRLARRYGRFEAEDLVSEALARSLHRPAPDGARQPWLEGILRNLLVDRARRSSRAAAHAQSLSSVADGDFAATPEDQLLLAERRVAVQQALPTIPSQLREAVVGRFYEEHDYEAVAANRGISPATARTRVHRALASLRLSLGRLRAAIPWSQIAGAPASATAALLPAALSAALIVPSLADRPTLPPSARRGTVLVAKASRAAPPSPPSLQLLGRSEPAGAAPASVPVKAPRSVAIEQRAQTARDGQPDAASVERQPAAVTKYEFENDEVECTLARPDGIDVFGDLAVKHASLIELRREFTTEIVKMLEDL